MTITKICPHCGLEGGFTRSGVPRGTSFQYFDQHGVFKEVDYDKHYWVWSKTVRCAECNHIRRDVYYDAETQEIAKAE